MAPTSLVSELGVPLSVKHCRKSGATDEVWNLIHVLEEPYQKRNPWKPSTTPYRNICILCCEDIQARTKKTLQLGGGFAAKHADHPLAVLCEQSIAQKAKGDVEKAEADAREVLGVTESATTSTTAPTTATATATPKRFFRASEKTLNVLISKWMISQGLPYTLCAADTFHDVIRAATGDPEFPILSRDRHGRLLNRQFQLFCDLVGALLLLEFEEACQIKFLNLMHDSWTSCGKDSIIGASVAFIDSKWRFRFIAMLASVKNDGHNAPVVAKALENGFKLKYNIDIRRLTRFTMSDTTPSAKNVADHLDTEQEDCSMHLLNLCIGYGIGLKDNIQTISVWDDATNAWNKVATTVTPSGAFDEGGDVIKKLRNLNNHFKSTKQCNGLKMIQKALSYPELTPLTDNDVRVGYTCKLIRRSIVNYAAFSSYFQSTKDSTGVWTALMAADWMLAAEMEAITNFIANLALVEAQREDLVSSYMVVFRRLAENKLKFDTMAIEAPQSVEENESTHRRVTRTQTQFSSAGKTCLRRTLLQLQARFPKVTKESMACILLDPRTKSSAKNIAAVGDIPRKEERALYQNGMNFLRDEHRKIFSEMTKRYRISVSQQPSSQSSAFS